MTEQILTSSLQSVSEPTTTTQDKIKDEFQDYHHTSICCSVHAGWSGSWM